MDTAKILEQVEAIKVAVEIIKEEVEKKDE